jgi:hypothetical protein
VALFRRKPIDPQRAALLRAFEPVGEAIEAAQQALLRAVPTFRDDGEPLGFALASFSSNLDLAERALENLPDGRAVILCQTAMKAARSEAAKLRLGHDSLVFEALNARVADILFPLEQIADLERDLRESLRNPRQ